MEKHEQAIKQVAEALRIVDTTEKLLAAEARVRELEAALRRLKGDSMNLVPGRRVRNFDETLAEVDAALQPKGE